jgi:formylglycine-generating enzyme required for sulfatase activity
MKRIEPKQIEDSRLVIRGGSWRSIASFCSSVFRSFYSPGLRDVGIGTRPTITAHQARHLHETYRSKTK